MIIVLSDDIFIVEVTYHPVRYEGHSEYPREHEGSLLIQSGCSCRSTDWKARGLQAGWSI